MARTAKTTVVDINENIPVEAVEKMNEEENKISKKIIKEELMDSDEIEIIAFSEIEDGD